MLFAYTTNIKLYYIIGVFSKILKLYFFFCKSTVQLELQLHVQLLLTYCATSYATFSVFVQKRLKTWVFFKNSLHHF